VIRSTDSSRRGRSRGGRPMVAYGRILGWMVGSQLVLLGGLLTVPEATAAHLSGIDVSHYQGSINWSSVSGAAIRFAAAKATRGTGFTDGFINQNIAGMKAAGIVPGAYHFAHPGSDPVAQADHFTSVVHAANGGSYSGLLQLVLDLEVTDGRTPAQVFAWTQAFVARVLDITGRPCIIYTGFYFWRDNVGNPNDNLN